MKVSIEKDMPDMGRDLQLARKLSGRTVDDLCSEVGISRQRWYQIEDDSSDIAVPVDTLQKIEGVLKAEYERLRLPTIDVVLSWDVNDET